MIGRAATPGVDVGVVPGEGGSDAGALSPGDAGADGGGVEAPGAVCAGWLAEGVAVGPVGDELACAGLEAGAEDAGPDEGGAAGVGAAEAVGAGTSMAYTDPAPGPPLFPTTTAWLLLVGETTIAPGWTGMRTPVPGLASSGAQSGCLSEAHTWSTVVTLYVYVSGSRWLTHATWLR